MKRASRSVLIVVAALLVLSSGCAKFRGSKRLDMGPFGDNTVMLVGDIQHGLAIKKPFYIKPYLYGPNLEAFRAEWENMQKVMRGIVLYSTQMVNLSQSRIAEQEKAQAVAGTIGEILTPQIEKGGSRLRLTRAELDATLAAVREQQTLIDALQAAQPLVEVIVSYSDESLELIKAHLLAVSREVTERMEQNWESERANVVSLAALQSRSMRSYALLYEYLEGDAKALDALRRNDPAMQRYLPAGGVPDARRLDAAEDRLMLRLANIQKMHEQLKPQTDRYLAETRELDEIIRMSDETLRKVRIAVILWARAHRNLSAGIAVPAEIDVFGTLSGAAKKALP